MMHAVGTALLHFLWQGVLVGLVAAAALGLVPQRSSSVRYAIALTGLAACLVCFVGTLVVGLGGPATPAIPAAASLATEPLVLPGLATAPTWSRGAAGLWLVGVLLMSLRLGHGWLGLRRLERSARPLTDPVWTRAFARLADDLGLIRRVRLLTSDLADVPMVVGWLAPAVLVPTAAFTALSPAELRAVLAHELAHVRCNDHLVNLAQCLVEVLLFFHPVTWWLSKHARAEREYRCDALATATPSDRLDLARALTRLEEWRTTQPRSTTAATGGSLMNRIRRILDLPVRRRTAPRALGLGAMALVLTLGGFVGQGFGAGDGDSIDLETFKKTSERVEARVKAGELTREQADRIQLELRERLAKQEAEADKKDKADRKAYTVADFRRDAERLEQEVTAGKVSREDADKRLERMRMRITQDEKTKDTYTVEDYERDAAEIERLVAAGVLSERDAEAKLIAMRMAITPELKEKKKKDKRAKSAYSVEDYERDAAEIKRLVAAGKLSDADGEKKLIALREAITPDRKEKKKDKRTKDAYTVEDYERDVAEIKRLVDAGMLSEQDAKAKELALREAITPAPKEKKKDKRAKDAYTVEDYERDAAEIHELLATGELSYADAEKKLIALREAITPDRKEKKKDKRTKDAYTVEDYERDAAEIKKLVAAGKLSGADGEKKLIGLRKKLDPNGGR